MTPVFPVPIALPHSISQNLRECLLGTRCLVHRAFVSGHDSRSLLAGVGQRTTQA